MEVTGTAHPEGTGVMAEPAAAGHDKWLAYYSRGFTPWDSRAPCSQLQAGLEAQLVGALGGFGGVGARQVQCRYRHFFYSTL